MYANPFCLTVTPGHTFGSRLCPMDTVFVSLCLGDTLEIRLSVFTEHKIPLAFGAWFSKLK